MSNYDSYVVPIYVNRKLTGTGLLLNGYVATVKHLFNNYGECNFKYDNEYEYEFFYEGEYYKIAYCDYNSKINDEACFMKIVDESFRVNCKPNYFCVEKTNDPSSKYVRESNFFVLGHPCSVDFMYPEGNNLSVSFESGLNKLLPVVNYNYSGEYFTVKSNQPVVSGYSGAPIFDVDSGILIGFVARKFLFLEHKEYTNADPRGLVTYVTPVQSYLEDDFYKNLFGEQQKQIKQIKQEDLEIISTTQNISETRFFLGRDKFIEELEEIFLGDQNKIVAVVNGMGGLGKTEVCKAFFNKIYSKKTNINANCLAWIDYNSSLRESIFNGINLESIGLYLDMKNTDEDFKKIELKLSEYNKNLFIFIDNMDDPKKEDFELLKRLGCKTIFSSRKNDLENVSVCKDVSRLDMNDCCDLYLMHYNKIKNKSDYNKNKYLDDLKNVETIVNLADRHTLMIKLLSATQVSNENTFEEFIEMLKSNGFNLEEQSRINHDDENKKLMEHYTKIFNFAKTNISEEAQEFLKRISIFPNIKWNKRLLKKYFKIKNLDIPNELVDKSWLNKEEGKYYIHPVISQTIMFQFEPNYEEYKEFTNILAGDLHMDVTETFKDKICYFDIAIKFIKIFSDKTDLEHSKIRNNIAHFYLKRGDYQKALEGYNNNLAIKKKIIGEDYRFSYIYYNYIASTYSEMGEYEKAIEFYNKVLYIQKKKFHINSSYNVEPYTNIASVYFKMGDYEKSLEIYNKALAKQEKILGEKHPYTNNSYLKIALIYSEMGEYEKALEYHKNALIIKKKIARGIFFPTYHNYVGCIYYKMGEYKKALNQHKKALAIKEKVLGVNHPGTANSYNNIALVYSDIGEYEKALDLINKALAIRKETLGENHPKTIDTYNDIEYVKSQMQKNKL